MKKTIFYALLCGWFALLMTSESFAFDGKRKGFIIGFGLGPGLVSYQPKISPPEGSFSIIGERKSKMAFMSDFKLGYAPSNNFLIFWASKVAWHGDDTNPNGSIVVNGVGGLGVTYYFSENIPSTYVTGTIGFSSWGTPFEAGTESYYGSGFAIGAGYEFFKHLNIEGNLSTGSPGKDNFSISTFAFRLTLNLLAY